MTRGCLRRVDVDDQGLLRRSQNGKVTAETLLHSLAKADSGGLPGLFKHPLERLAKQVVHVPPCTHECVLRKPAQEDRRGPRPGHDRERGHPLLRHQPLLGQALRQAGRGGQPARAQEAPRASSRSSARGQGGFWRKTSNDGLRRPCGRETRVPAERRRGLGRRVDREPGAKAARMEPKKDRWERRSARSSCGPPGGPCSPGR
jgi:hypothetical protein